MMNLPPTKEQQARAMLLENRQWFDRNIDELQAKYKRRYIAIHEERILGDASTIEELRKMLVEKKVDEEQVFMILVPLESVHRITYAE